MSTAIMQQSALYDFGDLFLKVCIITCTNYYLLTCNSDNVSTYLLYVGTYLHNFQNIKLSNINKCLPIPDNTVL